ncbi:hypothetical protein GOP47_0008785 [Adiantum capillus-veneris]|uniref:Uncharacterized protein n=1 Tax=Adiantum capillus-veneris TaxID=13818 RepID=A0A9D4ZL18_ADICA|nr:hypothetical protein GOP47_0008785 [Adiantum capillus-veneris]
MQEVRYTAPPEMAAGAASMDADIAEEKESLCPNHRDPSSALKLLSHNAALCRNFEHCKYLEIDLETACVAGEAAHGQLLKVAYEKDMIILDLEKAMQKLQEKANQMETSHMLKSEISDLHEMLNAMESSTQNAEIRHANALEFIKEENLLLKGDLDKVRKDLKLAREAILKAQKEITEMHEDAAGLRAQLQDALNDARLYQQNGVDCMRENEQLRQRLLGAQENSAELIKARKDDEILYLQQLKDSQMDWDMERTKFLEGINKDSAERIAKLAKQNRILRKRLKQSYQVLAVTTSDCNRLKEEFKAKSMLWKEGERMLEEAPAKEDMASASRHDPSRTSTNETP